MVHSSCLVFLLCVWFPLKTMGHEDNTTEDENTVPLLQDLKVNISPGLVNITWNCNITKSMEKYVYKVVLQRDHRYTLNVKMCSFVQKMYKIPEFILHKGVTVQLLVFYNSALVNSSEEKNHMPKGRNNSAAENVSCVIHNVNILDCSWTVGKEVPEDVQYFLVLRQNEESLKCQDYRTDSFGRHVGCVMKKPNISYKYNVYLEVLGLSNETSIQFFDDIFKPKDKVILGPPRNLILTYNSDDLEITWQKPETYESMENDCFLYQMNSSDIKFQGINITENEKNVYKIPKFHQNEKIIVTMRVKWSKDCSSFAGWSDWSEPLIIGNDSTQLTTYHILAVLGVGTAFILIVLIFLCYRLRIWKKLFPEVPKPSMKLFEQAEQKEKSVQNDYEIKVPLTAKDEDDFICSSVTEMPEKL